jgi:hypothetical protein
MSPHRKHSLLLALAVALASARLALAAPENRPGWAQRYLDDPPRIWDGWRNSLAPKDKAAGPLALAVEGKTDYAIVIPASPTAAETRAARELRLWLGEITDADFPIVADTEPARDRELCVGRTSRTTEAARERERQAGESGYAIVVEGERVFLVGAGAVGPMSAAFAFLEEDLGVRWFEATPMAGENWDARIKDMNDALNAPEWRREDFRVVRRPSLRTGIVPRTRRPGVPVRELDFQITSMPWGLRNRFNAGWAQQYSQHWYMHGGGFCHTFHWLVPPAEHFAAHPEYFSLVGGKRQWENAQLCLTNPEVAQVAAKTAIDSLRSVGQPRRMLDVSAMDHGGHCECENCRALERETGAWSGVLIAFVNRIAELVEKEIPDATITTLSYWDSNRPPTADIRTRPNVAVRYCLDWGASFTWPYHSFYDDKLSEPPATPGNRWVEQRRSWARWREISPRMHLWMYPSQYRHTYAPMPNIRAVAENIRYFSEQQAETIMIQHGGSDQPSDALRNWVFAKLLWDPALDVDELIQDFIWGWYGSAAPAVLDYYRLLWDHCARYTDFSRERDWIHAIHDEGMFEHGFIEKARGILARAESTAEGEAVRRRVGFLKLGVVYVEAARLYLQMRDGKTPPDTKLYGAVADELDGLCRSLKAEQVAFYDGSRTVGAATEFLADMRQVGQRRFDQSILPPELWGPWTFRWDLADKGVRENWLGVQAEAGQAWTPVRVPAFLADTPAGNRVGFGWYRTSFTLPATHAGRPVELEFRGVDEQAWVYVNGRPTGEHTLTSESLPGREITVADLWDRPFSITVAPGLLHPGENVLVVRIHNSAYNAGIHQPVAAYLLEAGFRDACDGAVLQETFLRIPDGDIPSAWRRQIQEHNGRPCGIAQVSHHFVGKPTLHLQDQRSHVAVWSASDEVLPERKQWAVQFDFRLTGELIYKGTDAGDYKAAGAGAAFGLKRGEPGSPDFLPLVQFDNGEAAGKPVTLLGLGEILATDVAANTWHRLVIHRDGATWRFYLDDTLTKTIAGRDTDLRGFALGSFRNWPHVAQDIHYANLKIGNFVEPGSRPGP